MYRISILMYRISILLLPNKCNFSFIKYAMEGFCKWACKTVQKNHWIILTEYLFEQIQIAVLNLYMRTERENQMHPLHTSLYCSGCSTTALILNSMFHCERSETIYQTLGCVHYWLQSSTVAWAFILLGAYSAITHQLPAVVFAMRWGPAGNAGKVLVPNTVRGPLVPCGELGIDEMKLKFIGKQENCGHGKWIWVRNY